MSAIITDTFRRNNTKAFLTDLIDTPYYVGIGKSDAWPESNGYDEGNSNFNVPTPLGTYGDNYEVKNNLTSLVGILGGSSSAGGSSQVIPNIAAKAKHRHKAYNPYDPNCFYQTTVLGAQMYPCYVVVNNNVYLCLRTSTNIEVSSYSLPNGSVLSRVPQLNADGSVWVYLYSVLSSFPLRGSQFITVPEVPTLNGDETGMNIDARLVTATGELVYGFTVVDGGTGYSSVPVVEYVDKSGAVTALSVIVSSGSIVSVAYPSNTSVSTWIKKRGYVRVATGNARVYAHIGPTTGFGSNPAEDLPSWYAGIAASVIENINEDGAYIPYRQVSIIRDPAYNIGVSDAEASLNCLQRLEFGVSNAPATAIPGQLITQASTGAIGIADYYDAVNKYLYYHQSAKTGFIPFNVSGVVMDGGPLAPTSISSSEYVKDSGEVVFVENRKKISRVSGQTEEITIILQF